MSLTDDDLQSIQQIVQTTVKDTVQPMIDKLDDTLSQQTAQGFAAVDKRFDEVRNDLSKQIQYVDDRLRVKDGKLEDTVLRVDNIETQIPNFKPRTV